jgi:PAS domain S-box-containing protein
MMFPVFLPDTHHAVRRRNGIEWAGSFKAAIRLRPLLSFGPGPERTGADFLMTIIGPSAPFSSSAPNQAAFFMEAKMNVDQDTIRREQVADTRLPVNSRFYKIITSNADAIVVVNHSGIIRYVNPAAESFFNRNAAELVGTYFGFPMVHGESTEIDIFRQRGERAVAEMRVVETEWGSEPAYLASLRDISDRKRTEAVLQRYERIVACSKDLTCLIGGDYRFQEVNNALLENFQKKRSDVIGRHIFEIFGKNIAEKNLIARIERCFDGEELQHRMWFDFPALNRRYIDIAYYPYYDTDEAVTGVILNIRDITQTKNLEEQLQQSQKMESIAILAGGLAHDFNNLLMGIQGRTSIMLADLDDNHVFSEHLKGIQEIVASAANLTRQLLGFARGGKYDVVATDLNRLIRKSAEMFSRTKKEIEIHTSFETQLWTVEVDRSQFSQVLLNLFVNAWQAMSNGGDIFVRTENAVLDDAITQPFGVEAGNFVKVLVTDNGIGMDKATRQRIFDPFFTTKKKQRGSGLGLASAYGIIRNHDGFIDVYSEIGQGTTFTIYLPASDKEAVDEKASTEVQLSGRETILLVDDEPFVVDVGRKMLERLGYNVITAKNGKEAFQRYLANKSGIDLVILDMIMPGMGGSATYERLQSVDPDVKALLSSGYSVDGQAQKILEKGCNGFIQKPFTMAGLSQKIREILDDREC